jgi:hypothetical protein
MVRKALSVELKDLPFDPGAGLSVKEWGFDGGQAEREGSSRLLHLESWGMGQC